MLVIGAVASSLACQAAAKGHPGRRRGDESPSTYFVRAHNVSWRAALRVGGQFRRARCGRRDVSGTCTASGYSCRFSLLPGGRDTSQMGAARCTRGSATVRFYYSLGP